MESPCDQFSLWWLKCFWVNEVRRMLSVQLNRFQVQIRSVWCVITETTGTTVCTVNWNKLCLYNLPGLIRLTTIMCGWIYSIKSLNQSLKYKSFVKYNKQVISKTIIFNIDTNQFSLQNNSINLQQIHVCVSMLSVH